MTWVVSFSILSRFGPRRGRGVASMAWRGEPGSRGEYFRTPSPRPVGERDPCHGRRTTRVQGRLKLIDFGIARAIKNDTTNIYRDTQIGTLNYMSPEAIRDSGAGPPQPSGKRRPTMKVGRASDVWSFRLYLVPDGVWQNAVWRPAFVCEAPSDHRREARHGASRRIRRWRRPTRWIASAGVSNGNRRNGWRFRRYCVTRSWIRDLRR